MRNQSDRIFDVILYGTSFSCRCVYFKVAFETVAALAQSYKNVSRARDSSTAA